MMYKNMKHLFILNPKPFWNKGKQTHIISRIRGFFDKIEDKNYDIHVSRFPRDAAGFIRKFAKGLPEGAALRVYAIGGDGILFDCLNGIMGLENAELAALPYGRNNNFVRGFGKDVEAFFRSLSLQYNAPAVPMDVIRCGSNYALGHCIVGMEAEVVRSVERIREKMQNGNPLSRWLRRHLHIMLYYAGFFSVVTGKKFISQQYDVNIDGESLSGDYIGIHIYNTPYIRGHVHPVRDSMPNDGVLDMIIPRYRGILQVLGMVFLYATNRQKMLPRHFIYRQFRKINIRSEKILRISLDGIVFFESGVELELLPGALQFVDVTRRGYRGSADD